MRTRIVKIGNSKGIRLPKPLLEETGLKDEVEISIQDASIIISPVRAVREGWAEAYTTMAAKGDDTLPDGDQLQASHWDEDEWEW